MQTSRCWEAARAAARATVLGAAALAAAGPAAAAEAASSIRVEVKGTVRAGNEAILFKGPVRIDSRTVRDGDFGAAPNVELSIDMSGVVGVGAATGARYVTQSRELISTPLHFDGNGDISIDFSYESGPQKGAPVSGVGHASFRLFFVPPSGALSTGRGWIEAPAAAGVVQR